MDARKNTLNKKAALALAGEVRHLYASKGKKVVYLDLAKDSPSAQALGAVLLGPRGTLRAPTLRKGKTLLVGFDEEVYRKVLG